MFDRLIQNARDIQVRLKRKRDLLLEERRRTTERVLRALSLFVEVQEEQQKSLYQVQQGFQMINMRSGRVETPATQRNSVSHQTSYIQTVLQMNQNAFK